jgi:hypothetical protein
LLALIASVACVGQALAKLAFARGAEREALRSFASRPAWLFFMGGASTRVVFHDHDPSFGARAHG